jgi:integrase
MAVRILGSSWWVDIRFDHVRYRKRSPENTKSGAQAYEALLRQKLARGEPIDGGAHITQQGHTFEQFAWRWFKDYVVANNKYSEQRTKGHIIANSLIPFFGKLPIDEINVSEIERYKAKLSGEGLSKKTINNRLSILNTCLTMAHEWLHLEAPQPRIKRLRCAPPKTDYLTPKESLALLAATTGTMRELVLTALRTGMRQGELKGLQWESIDWQSGNLVVRHSRCDHRKILDTPKSNRERHIPLDREVYQTLLKRKQQNGYVFLDANGQPFHARGMTKYLTRACAAAGLRRITWHVLRHTFASELAVKGVPLHAVQALLGHTTIMTTMRYSHVAPSALRSAIELLDPQRLPLAEFGQPVGNQWRATLK